MDLKEHQGKALFKKHGIPVPPGFVVSSVSELRQARKKTAELGQVVIKAQILSGKRGKSGGVLFADADDLESKIKKILGSRIRDFLVDEVLVEKKVNIQKEFYLSMTLDRLNKSIVMIFSSQGGVDIEETAESDPEAIKKILLPNILPAYKARELIFELSLDIPDKAKMQMADIIFKLHRLMRSEEATLVEINPLVLTDQGVLAADSKITIDNNAIERHPDTPSNTSSSLTDIERKAKVYDVQYVELEGDIGIIGNGAGLVMTTLDVVAHYGGRPANFLDIGGGASVEKMEQSLEVILMKQGVKSIFINIFGGITRCDLIAQGLANYRQEHDIRIPIVVRMIGTNEEKGQNILQQNGITAFTSMEQAAQKVVELAN